MCVCKVCVEEGVSRLYIVTAAQNNARSAMVAFWVSQMCVYVFVCALLFVCGECVEEGKQTLHCHRYTEQRAQRDACIVSFAANAHTKHKTHTTHPGVL